MRGGVSKRSAFLVVSCAVVALAAVAPPARAAAPLDLEFSTRACPDPVNVGGQVTYIVSIFNRGPGAAEAATVEFRLREFFERVDLAEFISATPSQGSCEGHDNGLGFPPIEVTCALGTVAEGARVEVAIVLRAIAQGWLTSNTDVDHRVFSGFGYCGLEDAVRIVVSGGQEPGACAAAEGLGR